MSKNERIGKREAALKWWREELTDFGRKSLMEAVHPNRREQSLTGREIEYLKDTHSATLIEWDIKQQ